MVGPFGGDGGKEDNFTCPTGSMVTKMNIVGALSMTAIQFNCNDTSNTTSKWYGNNGANPTVTTSAYVISDPSGFYKSLSIRHSATIDGITMVLLSININTSQWPGLLQMLVKVQSPPCLLMIIVN